jgi:hypothetical protein
MIEDGEDQEAVLVMLRERARQLDIDIEVLLGRRQEVLDLITSITPDARRRPRKPRTTPASEPEQSGLLSMSDADPQSQEAQRQPKRDNGMRVPGGAG